jgi:hypothetical protein
LIGLPKSLRDHHGRFLGRWRNALVTYGPIFPGAAPAGYLYQTDLPGNVPEAATQFIAEDPLAVNGVRRARRGQRLALRSRDPPADRTATPGPQGVFLPWHRQTRDPDFRNTIVPAHRAHLR